MELIETQGLKGYTIRTYKENPDLILSALQQGTVRFKPNLKVEHLQDLAKIAGHTIDRTVGSHFQYTKPNTTGFVTIPVHKGDISPGTATNILKTLGYITGGVINALK